MADNAFWISGAVQGVVFLVTLFTFITLAIWFKHRSKEREAFYKAETLRRITETSGEGAKAAIDLLREDDRLKRIKAREGLKLGGAVCMGIGAALIPLLWFQTDRKESLIGLIPGLIGVALLVYVYFMAAPVE